VTKTQLPMKVTGFIVAGLTCAGLVVAAWHGNSAQQAQIASVAQGATVIDEMSGETFTPETTEPSQDVLSAEAAYQQWGQGGETPPPTATVQRGFLTFPTGTGEYTANHQLVYAYSWTACQPAIGAPNSQGSTLIDPSDSPSPQFCTQWVFLDASTGELIDMTWSE